MDLLRATHKRSRLTDILYVILNIGLVAGMLASILITGSPWVAFLLVVLSKWRVFAVRPRYWMANVVANFVDLLVGMSVAIFMYVLYTQNYDYLTQQLVIGGLYIAWLLFLKPRSKRQYVAMQGLIAIFVGVSAVSMVTYGVDRAFYIAGIWLIMMAAARHILSHFDEDEVSLLSVIWGVVGAQYAFVSSWWIMGYALPGLASFYIPQAAIVLTLMSFAVYKAYVSFYAHGKVRANDVVLPSVFSGLLLVVLLVWFNEITKGGI